MNCPVCNTQNSNSEALHCTTCNWYFPLKDMTGYELELSRARQNFQMVSSFNQVFQHMQIQSKMLEKIIFRLDGIENEITNIKEKGIKQLGIGHLEGVRYLNDYPELVPIVKAEDFDTPQKRQNWWQGLEEQWQKAFKMVVLLKNETHEPTDEEISYILVTPTIRLVGPRGMHPSMDFEVTNLSGVRHLTDLTMLIASDQALTDLAGIEHLSKLESLFVNSNKLTDIKAVHYLPQLKQFYCNANQITDIQAIRGLLDLEILYCSYNQLSSLAGIAPEHSKKLNQFTCLPNDKVKRKEIDRIEEMGIICRKG